MCELFQVLQVACACLLKQRAAVEVRVRRSRNRGPHLTAVVLILWCDCFNAVPNLHEALEKGLTDADVLAVLHIQQSYEDAVTKLTAAKAQFQVCVDIIM